MKEIRRISDKSLEIIRADDSKELVVEGYAAVWNSRSNLLQERGKEFYEQIEPYAFTRAIENLDSVDMDCVATYNHNRSTLLARTSSGTLQLSQDDVGLKFRFTMPNTSIGRDLSELISRGDLNKCSFVARLSPDSMETTRMDNGNVMRTISEFDLIRDVSLVIDPAYSATEVDEIERSLNEINETTAREEAEAVEIARKVTEEKEAQISTLNNLITDYESK